MLLFSNSLTKMCNNLFYKQISEICEKNEIKVVNISIKACMPNIFDFCVGERTVKTTIYDITIFNICAGRMHFSHSKIC